MKTILLDCTRMTSRELVHPYLKEALDLPGYYGGNLDALYDCLTEMGEPTALCFSNLDVLRALGGYGQALMDTFRDAAGENPALTLRFPEE